MIEIASICHGQSVGPTGIAGGTIWSVVTSRPTQASTASRQRALIAIGIVAYVALATFANLHAWILGPGTNLQSSGGVGDVGQSVWFLGFSPHSLLAGRSILTTEWLNVPWGFNLMENTSVILPALVLAPVTLLFGPIVTFNVAIVAAFAGSATASMLVLRRWVTWLPAAWIGGLVAGFSPAMTSQGAVHLHMIIQIIPPLVLLLLDEAVVRQRRNPWLVGAGLGALLAAQLMISAEVLVSTVLLAVVVLVVLGILHRHEVASRAQSILRSLIAAGGAFLVLAAWPLYQMILGIGSLSGPIQRPEYSRMLASDLLSFVLPTSGSMIAPHRLTRVADPFVAGRLAESGSYLGIVLIVVLIAIAIRWRRHLLVQSMVILGVTAAILSMGDHLGIKGNHFGVPLPYAILAHVPFVKSGSASRYAIPVGLAAGVLLAFGIDRLRAEGIGNIVTAGKRAGLLGLGVAAAALVWLIPNWPYFNAPSNVPKFFTSGASAVIPEGSTLLTYPSPQTHTPHDQAMVWQVVDKVRWKLVGSYGHVRGEGRSSLTGPSAPKGRDADTGLNPRFTAALLNSCGLGGPPPRLSNAQIEKVHTDLKIWGASNIVVTKRTPGSACASGTFTQVLGRQPERVQDVLLFSHVLSPGSSRVSTAGTN